MMPNTLQQIYLATKPVDMRLGIDGLSALIVQQLGQTPRDGTAYVFTNRARNRIKLVAWDGNGVWLCLRRLHQGHFVWPHITPAPPPVGSAKPNGNGLSVAWIGHV